MPDKYYRLSGILYFWLKKRLYAYRMSRLFIKAPNPMNPNPSNNILTGSGNVGAIELSPLVIGAVALTQNTNTDSRPTVDKIYRSAFFIQILLTLRSYF